ncbi:MAG: FAD-binding oxidoreductase [Spirochaetota bacterium]
MERLHLEGRLYEDLETRRRYGRDLSGYRVTPRLVAEPRDEEDARRVLEYAVRTGTPLTCRGAGSNLSGSAVGGGVLFSCRRLQGVELRGRRVRVGPGTVYDRLNRQVAARGLSLRYDVSSGGFSTVGGNVATRAGGLRSIKYGTVERALRGVRFLDPVRGLVDTAEGLPPDLAGGLRLLREELLADPGAVAFLERRRGLKSSSGYNLHALLDFPEPEDMAAHLMAGSVGTLGIFTALDLELADLQPYRRLDAAFFDTTLRAAGAAPRIAALGPSALEHMDRFGVGLIEQRTDLPVPRNAGAVLLVELEGPEGDRVGEELGRVLADQALSHLRVGEEKAEALWKIRWSMLTRIRKTYEDSAHRFISFVDDLAVPPPAMVPFIEEIEGVFSGEGLPVLVYGHVGEGNLHIRPLVARRGWRRTVRRIGERCFRAALAHGGTLVAEHGMGRNRCPYLGWEWGDVGRYLGRIKALFDPRGLLNPGTLFRCRDITRDFSF